MKKETSKNRTTHMGAKLVPTQEGITLVALVITIIVMLILAGVAISALVGDGRNNIKSPKCSREI